MPTHDDRPPSSSGDSGDPPRSSSLGRRRFLQTTGIAALTGAAGCTGYIGTSRDGVEYWTLFGGGDGAVMKEMVDGINESDDYGGLRINRQRVPWDEHYGRLYTSMVGGNPPDIAVMHSRMMRDYQDSLVSVTDEIGADPYLDEVVDGGLVDGEQLAVPIDTHPFGLYYNKEIFAEAGLDPEDPPNTPDQFYEAANAIVENTDYWALDFHEGEYAAETMRMLLQSRGGRLLTDDYEPAFETDDGLAVVQEMHDWVHEHEWAPVDPTAGWDAWNRGEVGMKIEGTWHVTVVREAGFEFGMTEPFVMPDSDDPVTVGDSHMLIIPESEERNRERLEETIETVRLLSQEFNDRWGYEAGHLPASEAALESDALRDSETWSQTLETFYGMVENDQLVRPPATPNVEEYIEQIYQPLDDMRAGNMTPEAVLETAAEGVRQTFNRR
ncbi:extracellular solute-binding protein [Natrinema salifodinae]|uniref:Multiple sugar transport system substrate-binding protein n=1 Tax=Natrinema salifodinae TaxID=1202768 RepID=A0A1I0PJP7_9EURY|nr:extracellular solute-binding protein [Natrinema salifodinae]SEW14656.1 multiple sugar transport system substrate-binding protein [Natrinema salifodinae]